MAKKLELADLTPEQVDLMETVRQEWTDHFFNTKSIDKPEFEKGIQWIYKDLLKQEQEPKIVYCDSWADAAMQIGYLKTLASMNEEEVKELKSAIESQVFSVWLEQYSNISNNPALLKKAMEALLSPIVIGYGALKNAVKAEEIKDDIQIALSDVYWGVYMFEIGIDTNLLNYSNPLRGVAIPEYRSIQQAELKRLEEDIVNKLFADSLEVDRLGSDGLFFAIAPFELGSMFRGVSPTDNNVAEKKLDDDMKRVVDNRLSSIMLNVDMGILEELLGGADISIINEHNPDKTPTPPVILFWNTVPAAGQGRVVSVKHLESMKAEMDDTLRDETLQSLIRSLLSIVDYSLQSLVMTTTEGNQTVKKDAWRDLAEGALESKSEDLDSLKDNIISRLSQLFGEAAMSHGNRTTHNLYFAAMSMKEDVNNTTFQILLSRVFLQVREQLESVKKEDLFKRDIAIGTISNRVIGDAAEEIREKISATLHELTIGMVGILDLNGFLAIKLAANKDLENMRAGVAGEADLLRRESLKEISEKVENSRNSDTVRRSIPDPDVLSIFQIIQLVSNVKEEDMERMRNDVNAKIIDDKIDVGKEIDKKVVDELTGDTISAKFWSVRPISSIELLRLSLNIKKEDLERMSYEIEDPLYVLFTNTAFSEKHGCGDDVEKRTTDAIFHKVDEGVCGIEPIGDIARALSSQLSEAIKEEDLEKMFGKMDDELRAFKVEVVFPRHFGIGRVLDLYITSNIYTKIDRLNLAGMNNRDQITTVLSSQLSEAINGEDLEKASDKIKDKLRDFRAEVIFPSNLGVILDLYTTKTICTKINESDFAGMNSREQIIAVLSSQLSEAIKEDRIKVFPKSLHDVPVVTYARLLSVSNDMAGLLLRKRRQTDAQFTEKQAELNKKTEQLLSNFNKKVLENAKKSLNDYCSYVNPSDYGWLAFYDYFKRIGIINNENLEKYIPLVKSGVFAIYPYKGYVFAVQPPTKLLRNENNRFHALKESAVEFRDGSKYHFINGRSVPGELIEHPERITKERFLQEENSDLRGAMYEILGQEGIFNLLGAEEVCRKHANNEDYILYQTKDEDPELGRLKWVGVQCPSTLTRYLLGVPPETTDPLEGVANTFGLSGSEYVLMQNT